MIFESRDCFAHRSHARPRIAAPLVWPAPQLLKRGSPLTRIPSTRIEAVDRHLHRHLLPDSPPSRTRHETIRWRIRERGARQPTSTLTQTPCPSLSFVRAGPQAAGSGHATRAWGTLRRPTRTGQFGNIYSPWCTFLHSDGDVAVTRPRASTADAFLAVRPVSCSACDAAPCQHRRRHGIVHCTQAKETNG